MLDDNVLDLVAKEELRSVNVSSIVVIVESNDALVFTKLEESVDARDASEELNVTNVCSVVDIEAANEEL
jgi:uncharacterized FAD-dependent dehydrogenase